jgi:hypothetical protein
MFSIPKEIADQYDNVLQQRAIPEVFRAHYRKWLRYFLDFCQKYPPPEGRSEQIRLFIAKLRTKKQTPRQCTQAAHAISLYFETQPLQKEIPVSRQGFHLAMVFSAKGTYAGSGRKRAQALSSS